MPMQIRLLVTVIAIVPVLSACATKGALRRAVAEQQAALATERNERMSGDSAIRVDLAALRADLIALRTEFGAKIAAMEEGVKFMFPVNFAFDDASVRDGDRAALARFAQVVRKHYGSSKITVEGFADAAGSRQYNASLSQRRADAVSAYLQEQGLSADQLKAIGYGETRQVHAGATHDAPGAEENRRVVFVIETRGDVSTIAVLQSE